MGNIVMRRINDAETGYRRRDSSAQQRRAGEPRRCGCATSCSAACQAVIWIGVGSSPAMLLPSDEIFLPR